MTRTEAGADLVVVPSVAVTVRVLFPFLAFDVTVTVSVDVPVPPGNEAGLKLPDTPVAPVTVKFTVPLYPAVAESATAKVVVTLPFPGRFTDCELGEMLMLKVGGGGTVTPSVAAVVCVSVPAVPEIVRL